MISEILWQAKEAAPANAREINVTLALTVDQKIQRYRPDQVIEYFLTEEQKSEEASCRRQEILRRIGPYERAEWDRVLTGLPDAIRWGKRAYEIVRAALIVLLSLVLFGAIQVARPAYRYLEWYLPHYPSRWYVIGFLLVIFIISRALYLLKAKRQEVYAMIEYATGVASASTALQQIHSAGGFAAWIAMSGSVYIMVRAGSNLSEADEKRKQKKKDQTASLRPRFLLEPLSAPSNRVQ